MGVVAIVSYIILANILALINTNLVNNINILTIASAFCNYIIPIPIFIYLMNKLDAQKPEKEKIGIKKFLMYICICFTLIWIGNLMGLLVTGILSQFMHNDISNPVVELINTSDIWLNLIIISIIAPIFEEIFFRKILIDRTLKYGVRVSIITSAVLFAFFHGNINQFFYTLFMGGFLAYVYIRTGKITYTIILHMLVNLMGSVISLIISNSAKSLAAGTYASTDFEIVLGYSIMILSVIVIGIIGLSQYNKAKFNGSKTQIPLKNPLKTIFLNYGMICFIIFFILRMIIQI